jgi:hypothetical protein
LAEGSVTTVPRPGRTNVTDGNQIQSIPGRDRKYPNLIPACGQADTTHPLRARPPGLEDGLRYQFNADGTQFVQITFLNQSWVRWNEMNAGTQVEGVNRAAGTDIGLRRTRIQLLAQPTDRVFFYLQFGQNNFNSQYAIGGNRKIAAFVHDALCEYHVGGGNRLKLGSGLSIINGPSRFSQPSISSIMTLDVPVFAQTTVDQTDLFSRKLSVYARGQVGRLDYRLVVSDPFPISSSGSYPAPPYQPDSSFASFSPVGHHHQYQAYLIFQFFEHESHTTPYMSGTRLGQKKIWNIGGGMVFQKNASWIGTPILSRFEDLRLWAVESYLDLPVNTVRGSALSAYLGYFHTHYGTRYLRFNGIMNPANGQDPAYVVHGGRQGPTWGNALPMMGTGQTVYAQLGYLLPESKWIGSRRCMPYTAATWADYDALDGQPAFTWNLGCNGFIRAHHAKITLDWQSRPSFVPSSTGGVARDARKNALTLQYQIYF